jgi:glycosyltransferase involved in cell wall biosynthesis
VVFAARLVAKKGVAHVIAAHRELCEEGVRLLVVGDGPLASLLDGSRATVHLSRVEPEEMPSVYAAADVLVLPSSGEGLPLVVQEAMLSDVPAVLSCDPAFTSNLSAAPGIACVEPSQLAAATRRALRERAAHGAIAEWARLRWGSERFLNAYEAIYAEVARD